MNDKQIWQGRYFVNAVSADPFKHGKTTFQLFRTDMTAEEIDELIKPFNITEPYYREGVDQTFTKEQAEQIKAYLESSYPDTTVEIEPAQIPGEWASVSAFAVGGGDDFYEFHMAEDYPLPFKISGYYHKWGDDEQPAPGSFNNPLPDIFDDNEPQERQASNLSELCDYIRPLVKDDNALLAALIEQLTDWYNDLPDDDERPF